MADGDNELTGAAVGVSQTPSTKTTDNVTKSNSNTSINSSTVVTNSSATNKTLEQKLPVDKINNMTATTPTKNTATSQATDEKPPSTARKTANDFIFGKTLGDGSFSTVYLAKEVQTKKEFAIKVCDKHHIIREKKQQYILREKEALNMLVNDPFFVKLYCTFHDDRKLYFVLTYAKNGDLLQLIKRLGSLDLKLTQYYACELVIALEALKAKGIIHRDLKPENILLDEHFNILITDFGSTKILKAEPLVNSTDQNGQVQTTPRRRNSFVGTANYVSPELLTDKLTTHACDIWALGCVIYQMLTGRLCFLAGSDHLIFNKILNRQYEYPDNFSNVASDLIDRLLVIEADQRLGATDSTPYTSIRNHQFFDDVDWDKIGVRPPTDSLQTISLDANKGDEKDCFEKAEPGLNNRQMARLIGLCTDSSETTIIYDGSVEPELNLDNHQTKTGREEEKHKSIADLTPIQIETRLSVQRRGSIYHDLVEGNLILKQGLLDKKKGLRARKRMFLLTLGPHIYYVDPQTMVLKGQIPWTEDLRVEVRHFKKFDVVTPNRTYVLEDPEVTALKWQQAIEDVHEFYFNKKP